MPFIPYIRETAQTPSARTVNKMITIEPTTDSKELAALNEAVQDLHCKLFPAKFKPFSIEKAEEAFNRLLSNPDFHAFIAKDGNISIGYLLCIADG